MAEETDSEKCNFQKFRSPVTLTLHQVIRHTVMHHSSTCIYIPNFTEIGKTFCGRTVVHTYVPTDGRTFPHSKLPARSPSICLRASASISLASGKSPAGLTTAMLSRHKLHMHTHWQTIKFSVKSNICHLHALMVTSMRAPGSTATLIHLLISAPYIYIVYLFTTYASPFLLFSSLFLIYLSLWGQTHSVSRPEVVRGNQTWAILVVLVYFMI